MSGSAIPDGSQVFRLPLPRLTEDEIARVTGANSPLFHAGRVDGFNGVPPSAGQHEYAAGYRRGQEDRARKEREIEESRRRDERESEPPTRASLAQATAYERWLEAGAPEEWMGKRDWQEAPAPEAWEAEEGASAAALTEEEKEHLRRVGRELDEAGA